MAKLLAGLGTVVLLVAAQGAWAQSKPAATEPAAESTTEPAGEQPQEEFKLSGQYLDMVNEANMTAKQQEKLLAAVKARKAALEKWDADNGQQLKDLRLTLVEAHRDGDRKRVKDLGERLEKLTTERRELVAAHDRDILNILDDKQKLDWQTFVLFKQVAAKYARAELTNDQENAIRVKCNHTANYIAKAKTPAEADKRIDDLLTYVETKVLTPEQRGKLAAAASGPAPATGPATESAKPKPGPATAPAGLPRGTI